MIEEAARVVGVDGEYALVETQRRTTCGSCAANKGCGTATLGKVLGNRHAQVRVLNNIDVRAGDHVIVGVRENALVVGSLAVYTVPLLMMFGFALFGQLVASWLVIDYTEGLRVLFALGGLVLGFLWLYRFTIRIRRDPRFQAVILRKVSPVATACPDLEIS